MIQILKKNVLLLHKIYKLTNLYVQKNGLDY